MNDSTCPRQPARIASDSFLAGGGAMGALMRAHDWESTPLGSPATWPQSLRSALSICLNSPVLAAVLWGPELIMLYNDAYIPSMADRHPQALGRSVSEVWGSAWDSVAPPFVRALETGAGFSQENVELRIQRRGRMETTYWNLSAAPIRGEGGAIVGLFSQGFEITEAVHSRRLAAQRIEDRTRALRASAARQRAVFDVTRQLMCVTDPGGTVLEANRACLEAIGEQRDAVVGQPIASIAWFRHTPGMGATIARAMLDARHGKGWRAELSLKLADGATRLFDFAMTAVRDENGAVIEIMTEATDITSARQAEEALRQAQKLEAVGQLTGGVAHDFNNILTVIRSAIDVLRLPHLPEPRRERFMESISNAVTRATRLTAQLLAFARRQSLQPVVFDAGANLASLAEMVDTLTGAGISIVYERAPSACPIDVDPSQFDTAIVNLAVNARDAMNGHGTLTIRVEAVSLIPPGRSHASRAGEFVAVSVSDTGEGIPPDRMTQIFEPFFTTKGIGEGTGLGLSQVMGFAKQSGGEVDVRSTVGRGSTFTLYLPRAQAPQQADAAPQKARPPVSDGRGACVLVVEDNPEVAESVVATLEQLGYFTVLVGGAAQALAELAAHRSRYAIVFSDVVMAGMSGIELGKEIRRRYPTLPVVLSSGYSHVLAQDPEHGFRLLPKPYELDQLARVIADAIAQSHATATPEGRESEHAEPARLAALAGLKVMDSEDERAYDELTQLAAKLFDVPIALISLVDGERQWFKSRVGLQARQTPRELAFCAHAIRDPEQVLVVNDATQDSRFAHNPLVTGDPAIRFYAGAPLVTATGHPIGTLCVIDRQPRQVDASKLDMLRFLASEVMGRLERRR